MIDTNQIIEKHYIPGTDLYQLLMLHSHQVRDKALDVAARHPELGADTTFIAEAAMLHDIGIYLCNAPRIHCFGEHQYIEHGYLGADLLKKENLDRHALVCERHTGVGLSLSSIINRKLPLPHRDMRPSSIEEQIICYADKFYSKSDVHRILTIDRIRTQLSHFGKENVLIFDQWHELFI